MSKTPTSSLPPTPAAASAAQNSYFSMPVRGPSAATSPTGKPRAAVHSPLTELPPQPAPYRPDDGADIIDLETFQQILELDEDDSRDFSEGMVTDYFGQAEVTFKEMDQALTKKDLDSLSSLGHFLKGSSAALGLIQVQSSCERIQHYGHLRDEEANKNLTKQEALSRIGDLLKQVKAEYNAAKGWLQAYFA